MQKGGILPTFISMAKTSVKVDNDVYSKVIDHTEKIGGKIGKFFEIAAQEKLDREGVPTLERQDFTVQKEIKIVKY